MSKRTLAKLIVLSAAAVCAFVAAEGIVRLACRTDEDGNVTFRSTRLMPYRVPMRGAEKTIAQYLQSEKSALMHDAALGWNQRPGIGMNNAAGFISVQPEVPRERPAGKLRVALFGGSYTLGSFDKGWWRVLEDELNAAGVSAEVLNFGVAGFGMDQAYLRWQRDGAPWRPHVVVFGFAAGNCYDNVNVVRVFRDFSTGIPFIKPRFQLHGAELRLVNSPAPAPAEVPALLANFESTPLAPLEWFYREREFGARWWRASRFAALVEAKTTRTGTHLPPEKFYRLADEPAQLALAIVRRFKTEVEASGSAFVVAHLPYHTELDALKATGAFPFADLYAELQRTATVLPTDQAVLDACASTPPAQHFHDGHYRDSMHAIIGRSLARAIAPRAAEWLKAER